MSGQADTALEAGRHRALADPSRLAILRVLEGADGSLDVQTLADHVGLHVNTVRWHLGILVDAALVTEAREASGAPGRPRNGYRLVPGALDRHPGGFRLLGDALAEVVIRGGGAETVEVVGRERGASLVAGDAEMLPRAGSATALAVVLRLLEDFGFQPRLRRTRTGKRIDMRPCPFGETALNYRDVVCPLHLGLIRGALEQLGADLDAPKLEPFAKRDLCIAHLAPSRRRVRR